MNKSLIIIDDEIEILTNLSLLFEDYASDIHIFDNGNKAIEFLEQNNVDCIISDIKMPEIDGIAVLKTIRKKNINTPFIFFTGHAQLESELLEQFNVKAVIHKTELSKLEDLVETLLT